MIKHEVLADLTEPRDGVFLFRTRVVEDVRRSFTSRTGVVFDALCNINTQDLVLHFPDSWCLLYWYCHNLWYGTVEARGEQSPRLGRAPFPSAIYPGLGPAQEKHGETPEAALKECVAFVGGGVVRQWVAF